MRLPLSWLKEFVEVRTSAEKLAELLTLSGSEVEKIHRPVKLNKVIVGEIVAIEKHPNADRLRVAVVQTGEGSPSINSGHDVRRIVCGAPNIKGGQRVAVALPGAVLAGGVKLERRDVRGVVSEGMICAEDELGIGSEHAGILVLPADAPLGVPVADVLGLNDTVFDLDITPNRGDCFSIRGLAREIAALTGRSIKYKVFSIKGVNARSLDSARDDKKAARDDEMGYRLSVRVDDKKACPLYFARLIEGVKIGSSPFLIQQRLAAVGLRPINAAVDIANYVMMELGQPLHAFDAKALASNAKSQILNSKSKINPKSKEAKPIELVVRMAKCGETLELLDGKMYELEPEDLVIAALRQSSGDNVSGSGNDGKADDLAGVMGGQSSGTTKDTTALVLEAAIFDPVQIRRTHKRLGLRTEAAIRFEKKVDPVAVEEALNCATALILEHCGGCVQQTVKVGQLPKLRSAITVSPERVAAKIGAEVSAVKQRRILTLLGFGVDAQGQKDAEAKLLPRSLASASKGQMSIVAPSWRHDIEGEHDLVEEVGRMLPLNSLEATHMRATAAAPKENIVTASERQTRAAFLQYGFDEVLTYSFYGALSAERMGLPVAEHFQLENPLNPSQEYLRASLLPNLLGAAAKNSGLGLEPKIFEIGKIFLKARDPSTRFGMTKKGGVGMTSSVSGVHEELRVAAVCEVTNENVRRLKGALASCGLTGSVRVLDRTFAAAWKLRTPMAVVELVLDAYQELNPEAKLLGRSLASALSTVTRFAALPAFPVVRRDLSIVVPKTVAYAQVKKAFRNSEGITVSAELFEVFEGKPLQPGMKGLAFHLTYRAPDRTLTAAEVDSLHAKLVETLEQSVHASVR